MRPSFNRVRIRSRTPPSPNWAKTNRARETLGRSLLAPCADSTSCLSLTLRSAGTGSVAQHGRLRQKSCGIVVGADGCRRSDKKTALTLLDILAATSSSLSSILSVDEGL